MLEDLENDRFFNKLLRRPKKLNPPCWTFAKSPLCGARTKSTGRPCRQKSWVNPKTKRTNGKCWLHGGKSAGSRTPEGRERQREGMLRYWVSVKSGEIIRIIKGKQYGT